MVARQPVETQLFVQINQTSYSVVMSFRGVGRQHVIFGQSQAFSVSTLYSVIFRHESGIDPLLTSRKQIIPLS